MCPLDAPQPPPAHRYEHELRVAVQLLARRIRAEHIHDELSEPEFAMLMRLDLDGPTTAGELARLDRVSPSLITRLMSRLEAGGYVLRERSDSDARRVLISISDRGRDVLTQTRRHRTAWVEQQLAGLSDEENTILEAATPILRKLANA